MGACVSHETKREAANTAGNCKPDGARMGLGSLFVKTSKFTFLQSNEVEFDLAFDMSTLLGGFVLLAYCCKRLQR